MQNFSMTIYVFDHVTGECIKQIQRVLDCEKPITEKELKHRIGMFTECFDTVDIPGTSEF